MLPCTENCLGQPMLISIADTSFSLQFAENNRLIHNFRGSNREFSGRNTQLKYQVLFLLFRCLKYEFVLIIQKINSAEHRYHLIALLDATILFSNALHQLHSHNFLRKDGLATSSSAESPEGKAVLLGHSASDLQTILTIGANIVVLTYKRRTTSLISLAGLSKVLFSEISAVLNKH